MNFFVCHCLQEIFFQTSFPCMNLFWEFSPSLILLVPPSPISYFYWSRPPPSVISTGPTLPHQLFLLVQPSPISYFYWSTPKVEAVQSCWFCCHNYILFYVHQSPQEKNKWLLAFLLLTLKTRLLRAHYLFTLLQQEL